MTNPGPHERQTHRSTRVDDTIDRRLGQHAVGLLQAARDSGDPNLIAQAQAMAMPVGFDLTPLFPAFDLTGKP